MTHTKKHNGTCSTSSTVTIENGIITDVRFKNGCEGNLGGMAALCVGRRPEELIPLLEGLPCGGKKSSCPDQLARHLREILEDQKQLGTAD